MLLIALQQLLLGLNTILHILTIRSVAHAHRLELAVDQYIQNNDWTSLAHPFSTKGWIYVVSVELLRGELLSFHCPAMKISRVCDRYISQPCNSARALGPSPLLYLEHIIKLQCTFYSVNLVSW